MLPNEVLKLLAAEEHGEELPALHEVHTPHVVVAPRIVPRPQLLIAQHLVRLGGGSKGWVGVGWVGWGWGVRGGSAGLRIWGRQKAEVGELGWGRLGGGQLGDAWGADSEWTQSLWK